MWFCPRYPRFHRLQLKDFYTRAPLPTSLPTNQGSPLITIVLTSPKRSSLKIWISIFILNYQLLIINYQLANASLGPKNEKHPQPDISIRLRVQNYNKKKHFMTETPRNATKCHECHPHMFLWDYQTGNIIQFRKLINAYAYPKNNATPRAILGLSSVWSHSSLHHLLCRLNAREDTIARYTGTISTIALTTKCIKIITVR